MAEKSDESPGAPRYRPESGIAIGIAVGVAVGVAINQLAVGIAVGIALGAMMDRATRARANRQSWARSRSR